MSEVESQKIKCHIIEGVWTIISIVLSDVLCTLLGVYVLPIGVIRWAGLGTTPVIPNGCDNELSS